MPPWRTILTGIGPGYHAVLLPCSCAPQDHAERLLQFVCGSAGCLVVLYMEGEVMLFGLPAGCLLPCYLLFGSHGCVCCCLFLLGLQQLFLLLDLEFPYREPSGGCCCCCCCFRRL